jgi:hypothetical protein
MGYDYWIVYVPLSPSSMHDHALTDRSTSAQPSTLDDPARGRTLELLQEAQDPARCLQDVLLDRGKSSAQNPDAAANRGPLMLCRSRHTDCSDRTIFNTIGSEGVS